MGEAAQKRMTIDEFLAWHGEGDLRYELIGGKIVAMTPPASFHGAIVARIAMTIQQKLKPHCQTIAEAGIRLPWRNDTYYQADLAVTCTPMKRGEWAIPTPIVIVEVLSPTTTAHDRGIKLADYRRIWSVKEVLLIHSEEKRIELWRRGEGAWTVIDLEEADRVALESVGLDFPVAALYEGLDFSQGATAES